MRKWLRLNTEQALWQAALLLVVSCLFSLVARKQRQQREQEGRQWEQHLLPHALFKQEKPVPGVLTQEGMERMKRYMRDYPTWGEMESGTSLQFRTPGYDLTRTPETECSPPHFFQWEEPDLDWNSEAQVHREATDIVKQFWSP